MTDMDEAPWGGLLVPLSCGGDLFVPTADEYAVIEDATYEALDGREDEFPRAFQYLAASLTEADHSLDSPALADRVAALLAGRHEA